MEQSFVPTNRHAVGVVRCFKAVFYIRKFNKTSKSSNVVTFIPPPLVKCGGSGDVLPSGCVMCWYLVFFAEFNFMKERLKSYLKKFAEEDKASRILEPCLLLTVCALFASAFDCTFLHMYYM